MGTGRGETRVDERRSGAALDGGDGERARLERVRAFCARLAEGIDAGLDLREVMETLDPDPARYTDVEEGGGAVEETIGPAEKRLEAASVLPGHRLVRDVRPLSASAATAHPAAAGAAGRVVAALEWLGAGERVLAWVLDDDASASLGGEAVSGPPGDLLRPSVLVDAEGIPWVFYSKRGETGMAVWACRREEGAWTEPELVSEAGIPSFNQDAALLDDGTVIVCWQSLVGGRFAVVERRWREGRWTPPALVSHDDRNVWDPVVLGLAGGGSALAWTSYDGTGYATRVVVRAPGGDERHHRIEEPGRYSLHPALAASVDGDLYLATDAVVLVGHGGSGPTALRPAGSLGKAWPRQNREDGVAVPGDLAPDVRCEIRVRRLRPGGDEWEELPSPGVTALLSPVAVPRLAVTGQGQLVVAYRALRRLPLMLYFWEVQLEVLEGESWRGPFVCASSDGPLEEVALAAADDSVLVAWKTDGRREAALSWEEGFGGLERPELREHYGEVVWNTLDRPGRVLCATIPVGRGGTGASTPCRARVVREEVAPWPARRWTGGDRRSVIPRYRTEADGVPVELYWGDLHRHSLISRCTAGDEPTLEDFYRYAWDICEYDFWAVTDHAENTSAYQWAMLQKIADVLHVPGVFVPFYGFEWTGGMGHYNVIYDSARRGMPIYSSSARQTATPADLWRELRAAAARAVTIPHHPGSAMVPFDWSYRDDEFLRVVEVFQACRGNYEDDGCFRQYSDATLPGTFVVDGLRAGQRVGFIASSDHGNGAGYVGAYATGLSRDAIFDALARRHTIAATTRDVVVDFRVNDVFMGGIVSSSGSLTCTVSARAYGEIARVQIVGDGAVLKSWQAPVEVPDGWIEVPLRVEWLTRRAGTIEWSGRLEVLGPARVVMTPYWSPEVTAAGPSGVDWIARAHNFRSQYGTQRGGIELSVVGRPDARVGVVAGPVRAEVPLQALERSPRVSLLDDDSAYLALQRGTGGLLGMGQSTFSGSFEFFAGEVSFLYARVVLVDGEMAWSSPIWVEPLTRG
jgi:hypothetical protein